MQGHRSEEEVRKAVRDRYSRIAREESQGQAQSQGGCCGGLAFTRPACTRPACASLEDLGVAVGYSRDEMESVPPGANMGLGCGNPKAIASLKPGETVLDLGCGAGFDCFLAAREVGEKGRVIGVDMTPEMLSKARENAQRSGIENVEFRLGEIEHLPVEDDSVDVILSNCVVNLSPQKAMVFREGLRVLRPGGRIAISDVVARRPLSADVRGDLDLVSSCVGGAETIQTIETLLEEAGFEQIRVRPREESRRFIGEWQPESGIENEIVSATIEAIKPMSAEARTSDRESKGDGAEPKAESAKANGDDVMRRAQKHFLAGYHCAEVVLKTVLETFGHRVDPGATRCASGFGGGVAGTTEELCGAFTGGVMALGCLFGRENPGENMKECGALTRKFKNEFPAAFGAMKCATILKGFENEENPHLGCVRVTTRAAQILVDLIMKAERERGMSASQYLSQPRPMVKLGCCPFEASSCDASA